MSLQLDHLVVAAATIEAGAAWCEAVLGVAPGPGGRHAHMGTHNRLLKIASPAFPAAYLEIIAIDPAAPPPGRPRWFGLDDAAAAARTAAGPRLLHWVARSDALDAHRAGLSALGFDTGPAVPASRETPAGLLSWRTLVRDDGALLLEGALPTLIAWDGAHPTSRMADVPVALASLQVGGLPVPVRHLLGLTHDHASAGSPGLRCIDGPAPALQACLLTPRGPVTLTSG
jgi:hypothetical protein